MTISRHEGHPLQCLLFYTKCPLSTKTHETHKEARKGKTLSRNNARNRVSAQILELTHREFKITVINMFKTNEKGLFKKD